MDTEKKIYTYTLNMNGEGLIKMNMIAVLYKEHGIEIDKPHRK